MGRHCRDWHVQVSRGLNEQTSTTCRLLTSVDRLRGHRDQVTSLAFISAPPAETLESEEASTSDIPATHSQQNHLASCSKDTLLKLWDLPTQHCISTVVAHRTQVWTLSTFIDPSTSRVIIITGGGEGEAKAWVINSDVLAGRRDSSETGVGPIRAIASLVEGLLPLSSISHAQRISQVAFHASENLLAVQTTDKTIEILRLRTEQEIRKKAARRRRREKEKKDKKSAERVNGDVDAAEAEETQVKDPTWKDRLASWIIIRTPGKIRSFSFGLGNQNMKGEVTVSTKPCHT